jgi:hypothetical protein
MIVFYFRPQKSKRHTFSIRNWLDAATIRPYNNTSPAGRNAPLIASQFGPCSQTWEEEELLEKKNDLVCNVCTEQLFILPTGILMKPVSSRFWIN